VKAGKVRAIGASNFETDRLGSAAAASKAGGLPRYETLQPAYNLMDRAIEGPLQQLCLAENVSIISYYGLASGFLTGKYRSLADLGKSPRGGGMKKHLEGEKGPKVLAALDAAATELGATPAQVALAWLLQRKSITAPIVSATSLKQLDDVLNSTTLELDPESVAALDKASAPA
jgi:aryl-alcohol dehydrogenase-like predicted oxidoreductase